MVLYCEECAKKNNFPCNNVLQEKYPENKCEYCEKITECYDMPSSSVTPAVNTPADPVLVRTAEMMSCLEGAMCDIQEIAYNDTFDVQEKFEKMRDAADQMLSAHAVALEQLSKLERR